VLFRRELTLQSTSFRDLLSEPSLSHHMVRAVHT
jgi:hypothetical protein